MLLRQTIARNTAFNAIGRAWEFAAGVVLIGYVVRSLGAEEYGAWPLVAPFLGYIALLDLGIGSGFAKYIAEHAAKEDDNELSAVISSGFFYYLLFGALLVVIGWPVINIGMNFLQIRFDIAPAQRADFQFLFQWGLVLLAASNCITAFTAVQTGLQRMGITNGLSFAASLIKIAVTVTLIEWGWGVRALLIAEGASTAAFALGSVAAAFALRPALRVSPTRMSWRTFRTLFGFGWRSQIAHLSNLIMFHTDKLIVWWWFSAMISTAAPRAEITRYELGVNMANKLRQGPSVLTSALLPAASHLDARDEQQRLRELYLRSTKYLAAATIPLMLFAVVAADLIMLAWVGDGYDRSAWVLRIIAIGYLANVIPGAGVSIILGKGRADLVMIAGIVSMLSNIALTIILLYTIGYWGIPIATAASMLISWIWFANAVRADLGLNFLQLVARTMTWPIIIALPVALAAGAACHVALQLTAIPAQVAALIAVTALFSVVYLIVMRWTPFLDKQDLEIISTTLPVRAIPGLEWWLRRAARD